MGSNEEAWGRIQAEDADALDVSMELGRLAAEAYRESLVRPIDDSPTVLAALASMTAQQKTAHVLQVQYQEQRVANLLAFAALPDMGFPLMLKQHAVQQAADLLGLSALMDDAEGAGSHGPL